MLNLFERRHPQLSPGTKILKKGLWKLEESWFEVGAIKICMHCPHFQHQWEIAKGFPVMEGCGFAILGGNLLYIHYFWLQINFSPTSINLFSKFWYLEITENFLLHKHLACKSVWARQCRGNIAAIYFPHESIIWYPGPNGRPCLEGSLQEDIIPILAGPVRQQLESSQDRHHCLQRSSRKSP